jgi:hypothetical protein
VGDTEFETPIESRKTRIASTGGAESGAPLQGYFDPNIAAVVQAWPHLPLNSRRIIVGMARKAIDGRR